MNSGWLTITVDELRADCDSAIAIGPFGSRMKADLYVPNGVPVIRGSNISDTRTFVDDFVYVSDATADSMPACNVFANDLVFPHRGAIGEVGIVPNDGKRYMLSTSLMKLTCDEIRANPLYVYYFFRSAIGRHELLKNASTVGTPGIGQPLSSLKSIRIPLPSRPTQDRIADILGSLDDKIELNRRTNATLETIAQRLFKSWFVDFDPVHAKAGVRRQHPTWSNDRVSREALPKLDPKITELFPDEFKESAVAAIPKGWSVANLPNVFEVNHARPLAKGTIAPWLEMANMPTHSARALAWEWRPFGSGTKFINGDTLVARITPCLENGKTAFVDFLNDGEVGAGSTEFIVLRPKPPLPPEFAYFLARNEQFRQHLIANMTGTSGRQRAPANCLAAYRVIVPPEGVASVFGQFARMALTQMKLNDEESEILAAVRDRLLPRLLSGELALGK
jgi:type I restriction enzyme S subunit